MEYHFNTVEQKWQIFWAKHQTFSVDIHPNKPKYYVLDMFPYPSGAGLHVGHPLGYIASDIIARYKRLKGFNVLHPMGYDSFGLPAEQYAIQTGQHPSLTTETNIRRYREQLDKIGFSFDWNREVRTSSPDYYQWTQWIFMQLFNAWYNKNNDQAESIHTLIAHLEKHGTSDLKAVCDDDAQKITAKAWNAMCEEEQQAELLKYRLTYLKESTVNWCAALGTVLANDEVINGFSERGGHPVEQKKMLQWSMRISAYAERLLKGLDSIDWPEPLKEMQRHWIGKSKGALVKFKIDKNSNEAIEVFTTRLDTIFGVTFLVIAPEHELVNELTTPEQQQAITEYRTKTKAKTERERMSDTKTVTGAFTGSYALHPFTEKPIPIWIADYVLASYGTGAVMAVPSGDQRDYLFAKHFNLPIIKILDSQIATDGANPTKEGTYINSDFINGFTYEKATQLLEKQLEQLALGKPTINYRMRDAVFGRQRYWGEPVPVYFKGSLPYLIDEKDLPLLLPEIDKYLPTDTGEPPLARAKDWKYDRTYHYELSTMPGWAGSSWYWYRYMDAHNASAFASKEAVEYWQEVDLYIGGSEHATGHLLYARFWNKFLKDIGLVSTEEPFKKLINQGMIQGRSNFVYRLINPPLGEITFVSYHLRNEYETIPLHVDVSIVSNDLLDIEAFKKSRPEFAHATFILEDGHYICGHEVEKMSKSKFNVVTPDEIVQQYGADTLRLYEMFLGPLEQAKPWNTNGIEGVYKFLRKFWKLFYNEHGDLQISNEEPTKAAYKALHKIIHKVEDDIERFSFNTSVSAFMICVNELHELKCHHREILQNLVIVLSPYAPHICEELWQVLGNEAGSLSYATYPTFQPEYLIENEFSYPISINGKVRTTITIPLNLDTNAIETLVLKDSTVLKFTAGNTPKKVIIVKGKIVNVVL